HDALPISDREIEGSLRQRRNVRVSQVSEDGDYLSYAPVNLVNIESLTFRAAPVAGGTIEVRIDSPDGPLLAEAHVDSASAAGIAESADRESQPETTDHEPEADPAAKKTNTWTHITVPVQDPGGVHELFLVFKGEKEGPLIKLDWFEFNGEGVMGPAP